MAIFLLLDLDEKASSMKYNKEQEPEYLFKTENVHDSGHTVKRQFLCARVKAHGEFY